MEYPKKLFISNHYSIQAEISESSSSKEPFVFVKGIIASVQPKSTFFLVYEQLRGAVPDYIHIYI